MTFAAPHPCVTGLARAVVCACALVCSYFQCHLTHSQEPRLAVQIEPGFQVERVASGLEQPVCFDFAADGRVFVGERKTGTIRILRDGVALDPPFASLETITSGERGLLGIAIAPDFDKSPFVYALYTKSRTEQCIVRFTADGDVARDPRVIFEGIPAAATHNGGAIRFGPDGKLYFTVGDINVPELARHPRAIPGKLHRINPDGSIPEDNPFPGSSAFCIGVRNSFGFAFAPDSAYPVVYLADNGTSVDDEIHRVTAGQDLGWPVATGESDDSRFVDPIVSWSPTTAPVGIAIYWGEQFPRRYNGSLFVAEYTSGRILHLDLTPKGAAASRLRVFLEGAFGHLYALEVSPRGTLWFSNADSIFEIASLSSPQKFIRGNIDGTGGVTLADTFQLMSYLLQGQQNRCVAAADVNDDEAVDISDVSSLIGFLYGAFPGSPLIPRPFPDCGIDHRTDLECETHPECD